MIYSRHMEDAGRDRQVRFRKWGLRVPAAENIFDGNLRNYVVNPVGKTVSVSYLYLRGLSFYPWAFIQVRRTGGM